MKTINAVVMMSLLIASISCECYQKLDASKRFTFLSRDTEGYNGSSDYSDNLILDKDSAQMISVHEYIEMAKQYIDTVKADLPVENLVFHGIISCSTHIYPGSSNIRNYAVIAISFDDYSKGSKRLNVEGISLWREGKSYRDYNAHSSYIWADGKMDIVKQSVSEAKAKFDSLQSSDVPLGELLKAQ